MSERKYPILILMDPDLLNDADRLVAEIDEFSGNRSLFIRQAVREFIERIKAERKEEGRAA